MQRHAYGRKQEAGSWNKKDCARHLTAGEKKKKSNPVAISWITLHYQFDEALKCAANVSKYSRHRKVSPQPGGKPLILSCPVKYSAHQQGFVKIAFIYAECKIKGLRRRGKLPQKATQGIWAGKFNWPLFSKYEIYSQPICKTSPGNSSRILPMAQNYSASQQRGTS